MPMVVTRRFSARVSGSTWKAVRCDRCQSQFAYQMTREFTGQGVSPYMLDDAGAQQRAQTAANRGLEHALTNASDDVPCPQCLAYSTDATVRLKKAKYGWMFVVGLLACFGTLTIAPALFAPDVPIAGAIAAVVVGSGIGIGLLVARSKLMNDFDPNSEESRGDRQTLLATKKTILRAQYEALLDEARARGEVDQMIQINWR